MFYLVDILFFRIMANRPFLPIYPLNWEGEMAPLRGLKEEELRILDILLFCYFVYFLVLKNKKKYQIIHCVVSCGIFYFSE